MEDELNGGAPGNFWSGRAPLLLVGVLIFVGLAALCFFAYQIFNAGRGGSDSADRQDATPTPFVEDAFVTFTDVDAVSVQVGPSSPVSLTLNAPTFLRLAGREFPVQVEAPGGAGWTPSFNQESTAVWLRGTVVNYVFFLSDTATNRALVEGLVATDTLVVATKQTTISFDFASRNIVDRATTDIFGQTTPGITVVLVNPAEGDRLVVRGAYSSAESLDIAQPAEDSAAELGEIVVLDTLQISATGARHQTDRPEAPAGFAFYLVDVQITNDGAAAFSSSNLTSVLRDEFGNQYAANPVAGTLGNYAPLGAPVGPGQTLQGTVGFQIPLGLASPTLSWIATRSDTGQSVRVDIPFATAAAQAPAARVDLFSADVSEDGTSVVLSGQVINESERALVIEETDVSLVDQGTVHLILSTNPGFPWVVSPGQSIPYTVVFQRPLSSPSAVFTILNQSYQLNGLR